MDAVFVLDALTTVIVCIVSSHTFEYYFTFSSATAVATVRRKLVQLILQLHKSSTPIQSDLHVLYILSL
jgi:hypothetical protein